MKKEISTPVAVGISAIAVVVLVLVFYFGMVRQPEVKFSAGPPAGLQGPPSPPTGMPAIPAPPGSK